MGGVVSPVVVELVVEKVERRREDMVDLQRVDWIMEGICGSEIGGPISEICW